MFDEIGSWLFPEPAEAEPRKTFRWRQMVSLCVLTLGTVVIVSNALAWGLVPIVFSGFASAGQVQGLWGNLVEVRASQVERSILDTRERQCHAQSEGNVEALQFATVKLGESLDAYQRAAKREYRVPECSELVIGK